MIEFLFDTMETPIGTLHIAARDGRLAVLDFDGYEERIERLLKTRFGATAMRAERDPFGITSRLGAYFAGDLTSVEAIAVEMRGTPFQERVWNALRTIPAGTVQSYGDIATAIGQPTAVRAVGHANSQNPIAIVVPCHRVVGASAALTGYAGGLERKAWLLRHERVDLAAMAAQRGARGSKADDEQQARIVFL